MDGRKGFAPILIFLLIAIAVGILFIPVPYYEKEDLWCLSDPPQLCATKGWHLGSSLWQRFSGQLEKPVSSTTQPSSTPNETANWKTYTNSQENFSFKYPSDWKLREQVVESNEFTILVQAESSEKQLDEYTKMPLYEVEVAVKENKEKLTLREVSDQFLESGKSPGMILQERTKASVGEKDVEKLRFAQDTGVEDVFVVLINNDRIYVTTFTANFITDSLPNLYGKEFEAITDQTLSTLKFTD